MTRTMCVVIAMASVMMTVVVVMMLGWMVVMNVMIATVGVQGSRNAWRREADSRCSPGSRDVGVSRSSAFYRSERAPWETIILRHRDGAARGPNRRRGCPKRRASARGSDPPVRVGPSEPRVIYRGSCLVGSPPSPWGQGGKLRARALRARAGFFLFKYKIGLCITPGPFQPTWDDVD